MEWEDYSSLVKGPGDELKFEFYSYILKITVCALTVSFLLSVCECRTARLAPSGIVSESKEQQQNRTELQRAPH